MTHFWVAFIVFFIIPGLFFGALVYGAMEYKSFAKRLFKLDFKKHIISIITVTNSNPDVSVNKSKFINIIE